ncbi:hypothetical protein [Niabella drilacis]|uniref:Phosphoribosylpyrophosphate synthetase n=1 Tax=Niabella drilacis (strain DSM 25811 / CCM 8410 / CCUG 62505 / LMG 26954 / E90) TaxID=1285928 RepID=A0A1G6YB05_NIADE|nr:hypothetical protein [Niabella drilacis]SDD87441.1 hypothetical protein SAMN04487894_11545 [Niabella drilacis]
MKKETSSQKMNTISECINNAIKEGYTRDFFISSPGLSHNGTERLYAPEEVIIKNFYRFEGESDPADSAILYLLKTRDGTRGTLLDAYGVYSDEDIAAFIKEVNEIHKNSPGIRTKLSRYIKIGIGAALAMGAVAGLLYTRRGHATHKFAMG